MAPDLTVSVGHVCENGQVRKGSRTAPEPLNVARANMKRERLYTAADLTEAYMLRDLLGQAGIEVFILNEHVSGALGEIPFTHTYPEIWLQNGDDRRRAKEIVNSYEHANADVGVMVCSHCGEQNPSTFDVCWRCQSALESQTARGD